MWWCLRCKWLLYHCVNGILRLIVSSRKACFSHARCRITKKLVGLVGGLVGFVSLLDLWSPTPSFEKKIHALQGRLTVIQTNRIHRKIPLSEAAGICPQVYFFSKLQPWSEFINSVFGGGWGQPTRCWSSLKGTLDENHLKKPEV